ncbi:Monooxygenase 1 [Camellia lanceoleosa]|nr:Monooxygenase 1 [Camellia lanceoleosa]
MKALLGFPEVELELIRNGDLDNLFLTPLRYRAPWELLLLQRRRFIQGAITVAGDAMHAMGPFIAQGGSACLEDAVVLARCFAQLTCGIDPQTREWKMMVQTAIDQYVKQRRMRVVQLSTQTFLIGTMLDGSSWKLAKFLCIALMAILFSDPIRHTRYDCGQL